MINPPEPPEDEEYTQYELICDEFGEENIEVTMEIEYDE